MLFELFWWIYTCPCKYKRNKKVKPKLIKQVEIPKIIADTELIDCNDDFFIVGDPDSLP